MSGVDIFQLVALIALGGLIAGQAVRSLVVQRMNPVTIFTKKGALQHTLDVVFLCGSATFGFRVLCQVAGSSFLLFFPLEVVLLDLPGARATGVWLVAVALVVLAIAYRSLGASWRIGIDERTPGPLVTTGAYRWSRHPIYLAADLYVVGTFLINGTVLFLLFATIGPLVLHVLALAEERSLARSYGNAYANYKKTTWRYLTPPGAIA